MPFAIPAPKSGSKQVQFGANQVASIDIGNRAIVRRNATGFPAVEKTRRIEHGPQIGFTIKGAQLWQGAQAHHLLRPFPKRTGAQIGPDLIERGPLGQQTVALQQHDPMVEIVDAIEGRKAAAGECRVRPEQ